MEKAIKKKNRDSNIELLRIIAMCLIIFHHMALNTGIVDGYTINGNMIFWNNRWHWRKNWSCYILLITGYFSINKNFSFKSIYFMVANFLLLCGLYVSIQTYRNRKME